MDEENPLKRQFDIFFVKQEQFFLYALSMRGCAQVTSLTPVCQACAVSLLGALSVSPRNQLLLTGGVPKTVGGAAAWGQITALGRAEGPLP